MPEKSAMAEVVRWCYKNPGVHPIGEIAEATGVSRGSVGRCMLAFAELEPKICTALQRGVYLIKPPEAHQEAQPPDLPGPGRRLTEDEERQGEELFAQGLPERQVAEALGCAPATAHRLKERLQERHAPAPEPAALVFEEWVPDEIDLYPPFKIQIYDQWRGRKGQPLFSFRDELGRKGVLWWKEDG